MTRVLCFCLCDVEAQWRRELEGKVLLGLRLGFLQSGVFMRIESLAAGRGKVLALIPTDVGQVMVEPHLPYKVEEKRKIWRQIIEE